MSLAALSLILGAMILIRIAFIATQFRDMESFGYHLEHGGIRFQIARAITVVTYLAFLGAAGYALWTARTQPAFWPRYGTVFIAWFGLSLLARFAPHKFPRTNVPGHFRDAEINLITNLVMSILSGLGMTGLTALYYWWRG